MKKFSRTSPTREETPMAIAPVMLNSFDWAKQDCASRTIDLTPLLLASA